MMLNYRGFNSVKNKLYTRDNTFIFTFFMFIKASTRHPKVVVRAVSK